MALGALQRIPDDDKNKPFKLEAVPQAPIPQAPLTVRKVIQDELTNNSYISPVPQSQRRMVENAVARAMTKHPDKSDENVLDRIVLSGETDRIRQIVRRALADLNLQ